MDRKNAWKLFLRTGNIEAYLMYKDLAKEEFSKELSSVPEESVENLSKARQIQPPENTDKK